MLLNGIHGVARICYAERLRAGEVVNRAALLQGFSAADAVLYQSGKERQRGSLAVRDVDAVVGLGQIVDKISHLLFERRIEIIHALPAGHLTGNRPKLLVADLAVVESDLEHLRHIKERGVVPALRFVRALWLHAADDAVVSRVAQGNAAVDQSGDDDFVVVHGGNAHAEAGQLAGPVQEFVRSALPYADGERRGGQTNVRAGFHGHIRDFVSGVQSLFVLAAHAEVLEHRVTGECLCGNLVARFIHVVELDPDAVDQLLCEFGGYVLIRFIERIHVLVEATGRNGVAAGFDLQHHLHEPERLAGLVEIGCAVLRHALAVLGDLQKLRFSGGVLLGSRKLSGLLRIAVRETDRRVVRNDHGLIELLLAHIFGVRAVDVLHRFHHFCNDAAEADLHDLAVVDANVSDAAIEIVAYRKDARRDRVFGLLRHIGVRQSAGGFALPVLERLVQLGRSFFRNLERVGDSAAHGFKFLLHPIVREFRADFGGTGIFRNGADNQLIIPDGDRQLVENLFNRLRSSENDRKTFCLFERLGH